MAACHGAPTGGAHPQPSPAPDRRARRADPEPDRILELARVVQGFVLPPGILVIAGLVAVLLLPRGGARAAAAVAVLLVYAAALPALWGGILHRLEWSYRPPAEVTGQVLVVVGEGAAAGRPDFPGSGQLSRPSSMELLTALALYRETHLPLLFSGGAGRRGAGNEALTARRELEALGVPAAAILLDPTSQTTYQNARHVAAILKQHGWTQVTLVVSAFHAPRTVVDFRLFGIAVQPYPTDYQSGPRFHLSWRSWIPSAGALDTAALVLNELLALLLTRAGLRL